MGLGVGTPHAQCKESGSNNPACKHPIETPYEAFNKLHGPYRCLIKNREYHGPEAGHEESYLEIRHGDILVTVLDIVSPGNKTTDGGRQACLKMRAEARKQGANLAEIDLVMQGQSLLDYSREGLPDWDFAVTVSRSTRPERYEIYTATLVKRLPRFRLPLATDDRDVVLDLQAAFNQCFEGGAFSQRIDYRRDPATPLDPDALRKIHIILESKGLRPKHAEISQAAYDIWEKEGHLHGKDQEHWERAIDDLRRKMG